MKTFTLLLLLTCSAFAQFDSPSQQQSDEVVYCRGVAEVDENGNIVPDDPNCVPDPSIGGVGGIGGFLSGWF